MSVTPQPTQPQAPDRSARIEIATARLSGWVELIDGALLAGEIRPRVDPADPVALELVEDGRVLLALSARPTFSADVSNLLRDRRAHRVSLRVVDDAAVPLAGPFAVGPFSRDGSVRHGRYLSSSEDLDLLAGTPLEHYVSNAAKMTHDRAVQRLANRLRRERMAFDAEEAADRHPVASLVLIGNADTSGGSPTVDFWRLQSHPRVSTMTLDDVEPKAGLLRQVGGDTWLVFAREGDLLHPSLAGILDRIPGNAQIVTWSTFIPTSDANLRAGTIERRPLFDPHTIRHNPSLDTAFAMRAALLEDCPAFVLAELAAGRPHPLLFWLSGRRGTRWGAHAEALTTRVSPSPAAVSEFEIYDRLMPALAEAFSLNEVSAGAASRFVLTPNRRAACTSVLVCYYNGAAATLRCLASLARQRLTGSLEIILVDNRSDPEEGRYIHDRALDLFGADALRLIPYDRPFNHSIQNNLAAERATGEVVAICNNDVVLVDETVLEEVGAWALVDGIGTVGCGLLDGAGGAGCFGHTALPLTDDLFGSVFAENKDPTYAHQIHAVPGNTLAFAAMARDRFFGVGCLDGVRFPIGYNDVEFMLRCTRERLTHLYLGHLRAEHHRGLSRTGDNEDLQIAWIRELYPELARSRNFELRRDVIGVAKAPPAAERIAPPDRIRRLGEARDAVGDLRLRLRELERTLLDR